MSWICPHCGFENEIDPLNSRHHPTCKGRGETHQTADELEAQITPQIEAYEGDLRNSRALMNKARDHIASLENEISSWNLKYNDAAKDVATAKKELEKLRKFKIYRETSSFDKAAKARLDVRQKTLPFEGVPV